MQGAHRINGVPGIDGDLRRRMRLRHLSRLCRRSSWLDRLDAVGDAEASMLSFADGGKAEFAARLPDQDVAANLTAWSSRCPKASTNSISEEYPMTTSAIAAARQRAYELPLDQIDVSDIELFRRRYDLAVFRTSAQGGPDPLLRRQQVWAVLVDHQIQGHHERRYQPSRVLVGGWHYDLDPLRWSSDAGLYCDGPAPAR